MAKRKSRKKFNLKTRASQLRSSLKRRSPGKYCPETKALFSWLERQKPFTCYYLGVEVDETDIHIDHKQPLRLGGGNQLRNLCVTSSRTNKAKGQFTEEEFNRLIEFYKEFPEAGEYLFSRLCMGVRVTRRV